MWLTTLWKRRKNKYVPVAAHIDILDEYFREARIILTFVNRAGNTKVEGYIGRFIMARMEDVPTAGTWKYVVPAGDYDVYFYSNTSLFCTSPVKLINTVHEIRKVKKLSFLERWRKRWR